MRTSPPMRRALAGQHLDQLALAVARDAGDADDLARPDGQVQVLDGRQPAVVQRLQPGDLKHAAPPMSLARRAAPCGISPRADHHLGHLGAGRGPATLPLPAKRPRRSTVTSSAKAITSRNLWVIIRTVSLPSLRHAAQQAQHLVGLAGRQHRGRLVEDQEAAASGRAASGSRASASRRRPELDDRRVERHPERHARP